MTLKEIESWLRETNQEKLESLWLEADTVRRRVVGDAVHLRGLIEVSNHCIRRCAYCGMHAGNRELVRYRMTREEILESVRDAVRFGYGTVVMQAGESPGITSNWLTGIIKQIKAETSLAVTLSMGERDEDELAAWREAGADRYLLRFETSDPRLYRFVHPPRPGGPRDRFTLLHRLHKLGYEVGSGVLIGLPGQTYTSLARDIILFRSMDLDMVGVGPYIPHPNTPLGATYRRRDGDQVPATEEMAYKVVALTRLVCPEANIPSTTALATLNKDSGREKGLMRGANVLMPNLTPQHYRALYEIYPAKVCINETSDDCRGCMRGRIASIGRSVGSGPGGRTREPTS